MIKSTKPKAINSKQEIDTVALEFRTCNLEFSAFGAKGAMK